MATRLLLLPTVIQGSGLEASQIDDKGTEIIVGGGGS